MGRVDLVLFSHLDASDVMKLIMGMMGRCLDSDWHGIRVRFELSVSISQTNLIFFLKRLLITTAKFTYMITIPFVMLSYLILSCYILSCYVILKMEEIKRIFKKKAITIQNKFPLN